jgi:hypothetical protein
MDSETELRIRARIRELEQLRQQLEAQTLACRAALGELKNILDPEALKVTEKAMEGISAETSIN